MAEPRFFHPEPLVENLELILSDSASHHAGRVLRLKPGDEVVVFDGSGKDYSAKIIGSVKGNLHLKTNRGVLTARESPVMTELAQGISSADKMDFTLQKAVELGVGRIVPLLTHKCLTRLTHDKVLRRLAHWRQIVISACEQCGRSIIPEVAPVDSFESYIEKWRPDIAGFVLSPRTERKFSSFPKHNHLCLLVGPEGGLTQFEEQKALKSGFEGVMLGPRILRTETAALAALSVINTLWGDF